jgi:membrane protease YdiL (CAAX protease family)
LGTTRPLPPWDLYEVIAALLMAYAIVPLIVSSLLQIMAPGMEENTRFLVEQASPFVTWILAFYGLGRIHHCSIVPFLGLSREHKFSDYLTYSGVAIAGIILIVGGISLLTQLFDIQPKNPYEQLPIDKLKAISFYALAMAPFMEELVFRGFIQSTLYKYYTPIWAILLTSLVFTLFHIAYNKAPLAQLYVVSLGLLFGYLRDKSGSTVPGIVGHLFNNGLATFGILSE